MLEEIARPTYIFQQQNNYFVQMVFGVSKKSIHEIILKAKQLGSTRDQIYGEVYGLIKDSKDAEAQKIVEAVSKGDDADRCLAEIDVHNAIVAACEGDNDPAIERFIAQDETAVIEKAIVNDVKID